MLPFCERVICVVRKDIAPVWTRSFPISKEPQTIGEHLKKRRFSAGIRQSEPAKRLGVSNRTLSLWECDQVYPAWGQQPGVTAYLGYDPSPIRPLEGPQATKPQSLPFYQQTSLFYLATRLRNDAWN
jgi:transcriptional regulator with XRE-family HTH domain